MLLLCGAVFILGLVLHSRSFPHVTIRTSGCSIGMLQTSRRTVLIQSSQLFVRPYGVLEIISLSTLNLSGKVISLIIFVLLLFLGLKLE
ncbi:hypothetical protein Tco_1048997, partial [Tanacetum coccineum]